jgi:hypothetical protein
MTQNSNPPTEKQLAYAKKLNISIPPYASVDEASFLIELAVSNDKPSSERHRAFAEFFKIRVPNLIGKKAIFELIQERLSQGTRDHDLMAWFSYRVYRQLTNAADDAPISGPGDPRIQEVASLLAADPKVVKSARRYSGSELIYFGEWTAANGEVHSGGSKNTAAYKAAEAALKSSLGLSALPNKPKPIIVETTPIKRPKRRIVRFIWFIAKLVIFAFLMLVLLVVVLSIFSSK